MDIANPQLKIRKKRKRLVLVGSGAVLLLAIVLAVTWLGPALPTADRSSLWIGTVKRDDILPLAREFLARSAARHGRDALQLAASAERALMAWRWPGNVRELQHLMERAALLAEHDQVSAAALSFGAPADAGDGADFEGMTLDQAEAVLVRRALQRYPGNIQQAADALGITRQTLYRRMEKHGLREAGDDAD